MPTPSLLIVPARFKTGKLYSQIPTSGAGDFTVTRNTAATRLNSAGALESVASGIPRLDYSISGFVTGCPALLVEPAATNLCLQSEAFNTTWTRVSGGTGLLPVITANAVVAPDGTTTADTIVFDRGSATSGTTNFSQIQQTISLATSGTYTLSVYAKATAAGDVGKQFYIRAKDTLVSGTLTSSWVRYTSTETGVASGNTNVMIGNRGGFTADQSVSVDLWGAQLETGSVATSYIPTTTGTGSRSGDLLTVTGAVSGSIGQTAGTFYLDITYSLRLTSTATRWIQVFGSSNNIGLAVASTNIVRSIVNGQSDNLSTPSTANGVKIAWGYDGSGVVCFVNGTQYTLTNGGAQIITQLNQISLDLSTTNAIGNCRLRAMALYTTRLTNAELATLTAP